MSFPTRLGSLDARKPIPQLRVARTAQRKPYAAKTMGLSPLAKWALVQSSNLWGQSATARKHQTRP